MTGGVEECLDRLRTEGLPHKAKTGKLHIGMISDRQAAIGFCITSLTKEGIGEVEALFVVDAERGKNLGGGLLQNALDWLERERAVEQRLVVATGNETAIELYAKYEFYPGCTTLFRAT